MIVGGIKDIYIFLVRTLVTQAILFQLSVVSSSVSKLVSFSGNDLKISGYFFLTYNLNKHHPNVHQMCSVFVLKCKQIFRRIL